MFDVMVTKLLPPRTDNSLITRRRFFDLISANRKLKLILLAAPAGYGKTVLALQYSDYCKGSLLWYQLDKYDNDSVVFIQHFIKGMRRNHPDFGIEALDLISRYNTSMSLRLIVVSIINELAGLPPMNLTIVLDDYQVISALSVHNLVQELIDNLPQGIRMVITSRTLPPLGISRMQVSGEAAVLNSESMKFTTEEINEFLMARQISPTIDYVKFLMDKTNGWPAAIKLLTESTGGNRLSELNWNSDIIYDYLANEVLSQQPKELQDFLIAASILDVISPVLCNKVLGRDDADQLLDILEKEQFFLIPLNGQDKLYRLHQLFREFLQKRLGADKYHLLNRAGEIAAENNDLDGALNYFSLSGNQTAMISLIEKAGSLLLQQRQWQRLEHWLEMLTIEQLGSNSILSLYYSKILIHEGKLEEAMLWINKAMTVFYSAEDPIGIAECQFLKSKILNRNGFYSESLSLLTDAEKVLQKYDPSLRFELTFEKALIYIHKGKLKQAESLLIKGLEVSMNHGNKTDRAIFLEGLGSIYYMLGEFVKALEYYHKASRLSPNGIIPNYFPDFRGFIYEEMGDIEQSVTYLAGSIAQKADSGMNEALLPAYYQLSSVYTDIGEIEKAEEIYTKAVRLIDEIGGERFFLLLMKLNDSRIKVAQGRVSEAQTIMEQVLSEAQTEAGTALLICQMYYGAFLLQAGNFTLAEKLLLNALESDIEFAQVLTHCYFLMASIKFAAEDYVAAGEYASKLLSFSAQKNFVQIYIYMFDNFQYVLKLGLENSIEVPFIQQVLINLGERAIDLISEIAANPNPEIRIRIVFPLSQTDSVESRKLLQTLCRDLNPKVRKFAKQCMALSKETQDQSAASGINIEKAEFRLPAGILSNEDEKAYALKISMMGPIRIILYGEDITTIKWRFTKSRDLLLYLCHQRKPVVINQILEELWPDIPLEKSVNLFYSTLHWLRKVINREGLPELVTYTSKTCQLVPNLYSTDSCSFVKIINENFGENQLFSNSITILEEAVAMYHGDYLSTLDYDWVIPEREYLRRLHLETSIRLAHNYLKKKEYLKLINSLEPLAKENPLREEVFGLLMYSYAGLDDRLAVIRLYKQLKNNLNEELGIEPEKDITKLYYQLCGYNKKGNLSDLSSLQEEVQSIRQK